MYKLEVEQIALNWRFVREAIIRSYPHHLSLREATVTELFKALLAKELDCWVYTKADVEKKQGEIKALAIVGIVPDRISRETFLTVYSLCAFSPVLLTEWKECFSKIKRYAKERGCTRLLANTDNARVIRLMKILGGNTEVRSLQMEL